MNIPDLKSVDFKELLSHRNNLDDYKDKVFSIMKWIQVNSNDGNGGFNKADTINVVIANSTSVDEAFDLLLLLVQIMTDDNKVAIICLLTQMSSLDSIKSPDETSNLFIKDEEVGGLAADIHKAVDAFHPKSVDEWLTLIQNADITPTWKHIFFAFLTIIAVLAKYKDE